MQVPRIQGHLALIWVPRSRGGHLLSRRSASRHRLSLKREKRLTLRLLIDGRDQQFDSPVSISSGGLAKRDSGSCSLQTTWADKSRLFSVLDEMRARPDVRGCVISSAEMFQTSSRFITSRASESDKVFGGEGKGAGPTWPLPDPDFDSTLPRSARLCFHLIIFQTKS